jgi:hypothetical protein
MLLYFTVEGYMKERWQVHYCWDTCKIWNGQCQLYVVDVRRKEETKNSKADAILSCCHMIKKNIY